MTQHGSLYFTASQHFASSTTPLPACSMQ